MSARTITLTPAEVMHMTAANRFLTRLTERHHHTCSCELCGARMLTDVQDMPQLGWTIDGVTLASDEEGGAG